MKPKRLQTLTGKVVLAWMMVVAISNIIIGSISYTLYQNQLIQARAEEAVNVALAMAVRIDGDKFSDIMDTLEKNDYWYEVKAYADKIAVVFDTAYIYILDNDYTDNVTYFAEGAPGDAPFDLGDTEVIDGVYADEMFDTLRTGESVFTAPYSSGEYGDMVSGFAAITDSNNKVAGVVGVDFFFSDIQARLNVFALSLTGIVTAFLIACYFFMSYLGNKLAGIPLSSLDKAARRLSSGDMDVYYNIKSSTEIGRLADSFTRMIDGMREQVKALEELSHGNLTVKIQSRGDRDVLGTAIVKIRDGLNDMMTDIKQAAAKVSAGAHQISESANSMAQGANEQSDSVESLHIAVSEMQDKASDNLEVAIKTNNLTDSIKSDAHIGSEHMKKMTDAVKDIAAASVSINKVIKVIDDIAFQTNILALNAAVEAARAGQHGKGFAVVAEEVRNLAAKSAEAAKDTEALISDSMEKAQLGAAIADETAESLDRIIRGVNECAGLVSGIAGAFEQQMESIKNINTGIAEVSHVIQQNSATAEESAAASEQMSNQSEILEKLVAEFIIDE